MPLDFRLVQRRHFIAKELRRKASFYADNDQYGVLSLLRPQHVTHGTTRHYETQAFNPQLNAPPVELRSISLKLRRISVLGPLWGGTRDGRRFTDLFLPLKAALLPTEKKTREK